MRVTLLSFLFFTSLFLLNAQNKSVTDEVNKSRSLFPGDILKITVVDHEELSLEVSIDAQGNFTYPYCGVIKVENKTISDISKEISAKLAENDFNNVQVSIFVKGSRYVYVFGEVTKPLAVELMNGMSLTVIQAISAAEGFTEKSDIENISVIRHTEKGEKVYTFNAKNKIDYTKRAPLFLKPGDSVLVRAIKPVSVLGEVKEAGVFYLRADTEITLSTAIAMAGGFDKFADTDDVYLKRGKTNIIYDVNKILTTSATDPVLKPGDIIFVPKTRW